MDNEIRRIIPIDRMFHKNTEIDRLCHLNKRKGHNFYSGYAIKSNKII